MYCCRLRQLQTMKLKTFFRPAFAVGFICFCVYSLYYIMVASSMTLSNYYNLERVGVQTHKEFPSAVFKLYRKSQQLGVNLVAMDPVILSSALSQPHVPWYNVSMLSFGVFEAQALQLNKVTRSRTFAELEFTSETITSGETAENKNIACFLFRFRGTTLSMRIMVLYKRDGVYKTRVCDKDGANTGQGTVMEIFKTKPKTVYNTSILVPEMTSQFLATLQFSSHLTCLKSGHDVELNEEGKANLQAMLHLMEIARNTGKTLFVFYGSLLGWYRDCSFLDSVDLIDLAMFVTDFGKNFHLALQKSPQISGQVYGKATEGLQYELKLYGVRVDISLVYKDMIQHMLWTERTNIQNGQKLRLFYPQFTLCSAVVFGSVIHVPCPTVPVLDFQYGKDWNRSANPRDRDSTPFNVNKDNDLRPDSQSLIMRDLNDPTVI